MDELIASGWKVLHRLSDHLGQAVENCGSRDRVASELGLAIGNHAALTQINQRLREMVQGQDRDPSYELWMASCDLDGIFVAILGSLAEKQHALWDSTPIERRLQPSTDELFRVIRLADDGEVASYTTPHKSAAARVAAAWYNVLLSARGQRVAVRGVPRKRSAALQRSIQEYWQAMKKASE